MHSPYLLFPLLFCYLLDEQLASFDLSLAADTFLQDELTRLYNINVLDWSSLGKYLFVETEGNFFETIYQILQRTSIQFFKKGDIREKFLHFFHLSQIERNNDWLKYILIDRKYFPP